MEPTLSLDWTELQARVGSFLGWSRGDVRYGDLPWDDRQQFELDGIVGSGLRNFYYPEPQAGMAVSYDWSFLRPLASLAFPAGAQTVTLPDDYGGKDGPVTVLTTSTTSQPWRIEERNEGLIRQMYSVMPANTGAPQYVCERPIKGTGAVQGQRFELLIYPLADQDYTLQLAYFVNPDYPTRATPYAYGGSQHSETILESCYAVAEKRLDDQATVHAVEFTKRLAASISMDRKNKPQKLGVNRDRSDDVYGRGREAWFAPAGTYNGRGFD